MGTRDKSPADYPDEPRRERGQKNEGRRNKQRNTQVKCDANDGNQEFAFEESDHANGQRDVKERSQDCGANPHEPCAPQELGRYGIRWEPNEQGLLLERGRGFAGPANGLLTY